MAICLCHSVTHAYGKVTEWHMAKITQETIVINDYGKSRANTRRRTSKKGKTTQRVSIEIEAEPVLHVFDDRALGSDVAEAIRDHIGKAIKDIGGFVKQSTRRRKCGYHGGIYGNDVSVFVENRAARGTVGGSGIVNNFSLSDSAAHSTRGGRCDEILAGHFKCQLAVGFKVLFAGQVDFILG